MNKLTTMAVLVALTACLGACGSDNEPQHADTQTLRATGLQAKTVTGSSFFDYAGVTLDFEVDYLAGKADVRMANAKLAADGAQNMTLTFAGLNTDLESRLLFGLSGTGITPLAGCSATGVACRVDHEAGMHSMRFGLAGRYGDAQVYVYPADLRSAAYGGQGNAADDGFYCDLHCGIGGDGAYEGYATLHNVQFQIGPRRSPQMTIRIPYDEHVAVAGTARGYTATGSGITGLYRQGTVEVPFDTSTIDDMKIDVDIVGKVYSIYFRCMGGEYSQSGSLYL